MQWVPKTWKQEAQTSRTADLSHSSNGNPWNGLVNFRGQHALATVDYYSGFLTYDTLVDETTEAVTAVLKNVFRKFGLAEKIISDKGPCFKSDDFRRFCHQFEIGHVTSSPYHHQSNGYAERAIATVEQILKKSTSDIDITKALTTYLDTPVSNNLPSPAELFYSRPINTRLSIAMTPALLTDQQKSQLSEKRSAHLEPIKQDNYIYLPGQPIWFTDDDSDEWKPGYIESKDTSPDLYWIINDKTNRRNKRDIKPRYAAVAQQWPQAQIPIRCPVNLSDENLTPLNPPTFLLALINLKIFSSPYHNSNINTFLCQWQIHGKYFSPYIYVVGWRLAHISASKLESWVCLLD